MIQLLLADAQEILDVRFIPVIQHLTPVDIAKSDHTIPRVQITSPHLSHTTSYRASTLHVPEHSGHLILAIFPTGDRID